MYIMYISCVSVYAFTPSVISQSEDAYVHCTDCYGWKSVKQFLHILQALYLYICIYQYGLSCLK